MKIGKAHRYLGKNYAAGEEFEDEAHRKWADNPVRNYAKSVPVQPAKKPQTAK